ncbi:MAG: UDP-N-acetylmuramoyl-L-alanyl-D-glutamate--2,6-diaminopimelate ligase [Desulfobulbus propionicus]|nr:MAG: UDP-N-acetylmuramoyl-L-alanyl-D-glutamate--2,6-diaminopimelate ligase [Desulfobulbus propionicus]
MPTLQQLLQQISGVKSSHLSRSQLNAEVIGVTDDSRKAGRGVVFVALRGSRTDGHEYVLDALQRGCPAAVISETFPGEQPGQALVNVNDTRRALGELAAYLSGFSPAGMCLVGITGTNGKTTTSWLVEQVLVRAGLRTGVIGTINYRYFDGTRTRVLLPAPLTTPDPVTLFNVLAAMQEKGVTHVVIEVSSHALEQQRLGPLVFDAACFTNLSRDHLDYHATMEMYFAAKKTLFSRYLRPGGAAVIVTGDDQGPLQFGVRLAAELGGVVMRCGFAADTEVQAQAFRHGVDGFTGTVRCLEEQAVLTSRLTGAHNVLNMLCAVGIGHALGLGLPSICEGLAHVSRIPGRLERVRLPGGPAASTAPAVFTDYAHTPDALEHALVSLKGLTGGRLFCVFGCGGDRDRGKRPMMGQVAAAHADVTIVTSDNPRTEKPEAIIDEILAGVRESGTVICDQEDLGRDGSRGCLVCSDRARAIEMACSRADGNDVVLIAGKGHEEYQIVGTQKQYFDDRVEAINSLLRWNREHLLAATGATVIQAGGRPLSGAVCTDTRQLRPGALFVALHGERFDGHDFLGRAVEQGAAALLVNRLPEKLPEDVMVVQVEDTLRALGDLAGYRRRLLDREVTTLAITGSSGKTTVKEMAAAIFSVHASCPFPGCEPVLKTRGNFNNLVGLPRCLLELDGRHRFAVLEMGMNHPGEIDRLTEIVCPDIGCITNIQAAHLEGLGSLAGVAKAKGELFTRMGPATTLCVNLDDPLVRELVGDDNREVITYAANKKGRRLHPRVRATRIVSQDERGTRFTLHVDDWSRRFTLPVPGLHNVSNSLAAAALAVAAGVSGEEIVAGLAHYRGMENRLMISTLPGGLHVVNDAYNANPASMAAALETVAGFAAGGRRVAALGEMLELGPAAEAAHRRLGEQVAALGFDTLLITGPSAEIVAEAAQEAGLHAVQIHENAASMAPWLYHMITSGVLGSSDWLLVKGSRGMRMETCLEETMNLLEMGQNG